MTGLYRTSRTQRLSARAAQVLLLFSIAGCGSDLPTACCTTDEATLRVVNAFTTPIDVLIDGNVAIGSLAAGAVGTAMPASGSHTVGLRSTVSGSSASQSITTITGAMSTIAAVLSLDGTMAATVLDDTNSVVPAERTKLRVLHLAPSAGTLQVYRTQPDYQEPAGWQSPFDYQPEPTSGTAPFFESAVGSWEVRIWQTPADASGWADATVRAVIPLASGEKKTVVILDKPGGGVRVELF